MISFGAWKKPFSTRRFQNHWNGRKEKIRTHSDLEMSSDDTFLAPQVGLEPTTLRLTAECSAIELLRNIGMRRRSTLPGRVQPSTIDVLRLNFCVRNGNRWNPQAIATAKGELCLQGACCRRHYTAGPPHPDNRTGRTDHLCVGLGKID